MPHYIEYEELARNGIKYFDRNFCTVIALATVCDLSYRRAYKKLEREGRKKGRGTYPFEYHQAIKKQGYRIDRVDFRKDGVRTLAQAQKKYTSGKYLVETRKHISAIVNGDLNDWTNPEKTKRFKKKQRSRREVVTVFKCIYEGRTYKGEI